MDYFDPVRGGPVAQHSVIGYEAGKTPAVEVLSGAMCFIEALDGLDRALLSSVDTAIHNTVRVQTELGDLELPLVPISVSARQPAIANAITNRGEEIFKIKSPDMLGEAQWTVLRNNRTTRVNMLHRGFLERYHRREVGLLPGDALHCRIEETIQYDAAGQEIERRVSIIEVLKVISPPIQGQLWYNEKGES